MGMDLKTYLQANQQTSLQDHLRGQIEAAAVEINPVAHAAIAYFNTVTITDDAPAAVYNVLVSGTLLSITRELLRLQRDNVARPRTRAAAPFLMTGDPTLWQQVVDAAKEN
jgi:hypothetical protein